MMETVTYDCWNCRYSLGGGLCRLNLEGECAAGDERVAWEPKEDNFVNEKHVYKLMRDFTDIDNKKDLARNKLSLSDYWMLNTLLADVLNGRPATTISKNVADWCRRHHLVVTEYEIGWMVQKEAPKEEQDER